MIGEFKGGIPPQEQEKTPREIIDEFKNDFEEYLEANPDVALKLKKEILSMAGVEEGELADESVGLDYGLVKVPAEKLVLFGTRCGNVGNKAFSEEVVNFLQSQKVEFILGLSQNAEFTISSAAIQINEKNGSKLERMIDKNNGSLRCDSSRVKGWTMYESE